MCHLHRSCGYEPELVAFDVKRQVEPELVVPPYARAEEQHGVRFTFYAAEAAAVVARARFSGLEGADLAAAVDSDLNRLALSARDAEALVRRGTPVAHSVLMVVGRPPTRNARPKGRALAFRGGDVCRCGTAQYVAGEERGFFQPPATLYDFGGTPGPIQYPVAV